MTPDAITRVVNEAYDTFPPLEGKPMDDDLLAVWEVLLPLLIVIPYDQLNGIHSLTAILTEAAKYEAEHGTNTFVRPIRLPLYDKNIAGFVQSRPIKPALMTTPVTKRPSVASPNFSATSLMRSGTTISKTPIPSTPRSWPSTSWPSLMPTAGGYMPST